MASSRRRFIRNATALSAVLVGKPKFLSASQEGNNERPSELLQWVDPRIGCGGFGHCYPGATLPFGSVQLSPDTHNAGWNRCSGYHWDDKSIMGFSHTHLSGTGVGDMLDFLVMAGTGVAKLTPGEPDRPDTGYRSRFNHTEELASPGYYAVTLRDYQIRAELTATERAGFHRYTFPKSDSAYLIIDLEHSYLWHNAPTVKTATITSAGPTTLAGGHVTSAWSPNRHAYFSLEVSRMPKRVVFYEGEREIGGSAPIHGQSLKCVMYFDTNEGEKILVKVGISATSSDGAQRNLAKELPHWDFDQVRSDAQLKWSKQLNKIQVEGDGLRKRVFYSALYHLSLGPTLFDDVDGQYRGMDNKVHLLGEGQHNYTTFSLWDTYRAAHPAYVLIEPKRTPHFIATLIRMAEESPAGMPVWPLCGVETGCMTGYHSAAVIADACTKGVVGPDYAKAYGLMRKRAMEEDYRGLGWYRKLGYIPADHEPESVSKTFEYCYDDWSIARVAKHLGKDAEATALVQRSTNYRHYFDMESKFIRPKMENGTWAQPFDPKAMGHSKQWRDFTESDSWQTTFAIQHDPRGMIDLFGGNEAFVEKLDRLFQESSELHGDVPPDITGMIGQYAHGNEPSHHISYLYSYAGKPHKTQARVRELLDKMYVAAPDGLQGNEDVGQMSAWYVLSALGFYPVDPVSGNYVLGSPVFDRAVLDMGNGRQLKIEVRRKSPDDRFIHAFSIDGRPQQRVWFNHSEIVRGAKLVLTMGAEPNEAFASSLNDAPPSLTL